MDWDGLELVTAQEVGDEIEAVGIRAHDFEPLSSVEALEWKKREDANLIPVEDAEISEMPFAFSRMSVNMTGTPVSLAQRLYLPS